jgi:pimeloyl-ACP methyl ester carboxylesterase
MAAAIPNNSTIVRAPLALRAARGGLAVVAGPAPHLAARLAESMFLTARRRPRPKWEGEALATAARTKVRYEDGTLPVWTWSPATRAIDPPTVLLVHGWEGRGAQLAPFASPLTARGFRVVTFDAPGHGDATPRRASLVEHARAIALVAKAIARRGPLAAVVGHSLGGAATLVATRLGLRADRYALIAPPRSPARFVKSFSSILGLDANVEAEMIERIEARYTMSFDDLDVRADAARLAEPLLVVHDADDDVVAALDGATIAAAAPRGRLVATSGLGHERVLRAPEIVEEVTAFVANGARAPSLAETIDGDLFYRDSRWSHS